MNQAGAGTDEDQGHVAIAVHGREGLNHIITRASVDIAVSRLLFAVQSLFAVARVETANAATGSDLSVAIAVRGCGG